MYAPTRIITNSILVHLFYSETALFNTILVVITIGQTTFRIAAFRQITILKVTYDRLPRR